MKHMTYLPKVPIDPKRVSVSGISAGAFMAHQLHVAYSDVFCGAGLIAGGPYLSSQSTLWGALAHGLHGMPPPDAVQLSLLTQTLADVGAIAPVHNLADARVWVFHGKRDHTVKRSVVDQLVKFYAQFMQAGDLKFVTDVDVSHAMPTDRYGSEPDSHPTTPYLVNCDYDAAGELLQYLHGPLQPRTNELSGVLCEFDQSRYMHRDLGQLMDPYGFVYLPKGVYEGRTCGIHVALHGCQQHRGAVGDVFAQHAGYNAWAEANDLIVLYPQACASHLITAFNPLGSWDWWSYTGPDYALRDGAQMQVIVRMLEALGLQ
jgi:poly(3-hydroxybutyrate) depolymerase